MEGNRPFQPLLKTLQKGIIKCLPHARQMVDALSPARVQESLISSLLKNKAFSEAVKE